MQEQPRLCPKLAAWFVFVFFVVEWAFTSPASAQVSAVESARRLKAAPGLEATLWAAEPMLLNPTNIDVDSRGRVWVTEGLNYRLTRGGNARFHRVDDSDKIKILEDTDGDGEADKMTVFADKIFPVPMGIAVEEHYSKEGKYTGCRVFVGNSPDLLVLEDTDGDDKADKRYPLLTGFGGVDSDHGVHGMVLGMDGKLYFTQGDGCCSVQKDRSERQQNFDVIDKSGRHVKSNQLANTLRVNRDGTQFEVICDRQRNNYETCLNSFGTIFTSDNDDDGNRGCRVIWAMDGGHYGYHTPGSPRHWGEDVPGNVPKLVGTGNGSPAGIMVYEGSLFPKEYFGAVLEVDAGTRQVNFFPITRHGASLRTEYKVFLSSDDPWFRPIDACAAPDGSVFVADWYDAGVGGHAFSDQTTGRIYRVAPKGHKTQKVKYDFASVNGLIEALKSPNIATQDAARRGLIERIKQASLELSLLAQRGDPIARARALWVFIGANNHEAIGISLVADKDPRIWEQCTRILGRDCRENGNLEFLRLDAKQSPAALAHLPLLLVEADHPDPGVRRELILAFRNLPTDKVGDALKKLTASWDGQDRWYLEALGLALEKREPAYLSSLFDGKLFGPLDLEREGKDGTVALPPYFPVDRNEAYIPAGAPDLPATSLSKYLGLAWRLRRGESLDFLAKVMPALTAPELEQAGDDIMRQMADPRGAQILADLAYGARNPVRKRQLLTTLARKMAGQWNAERNNPRVATTIKEALEKPELRAEGIELAAATRDARYEGALETFVQDAALPDTLRVAAVEAIGMTGAPSSRPLLDRLIDGTKGRPNANPVNEAAVRTLTRRSDAANRLSGLIDTRDFPLGVRREALRTLALVEGGARRILDMAKAGKLPGDLTTEATTILHTTFTLDRRLRDEAARVLPLPKSSSGRPLPPFGQLIRREGRPEQGHAVFFRTGLNSCANCHRVRGQGQWVGPDLSTIGTKYGKDELFRSILNPSAAIGYNYRALILGLNDGRVVTGLPVEDTPERLVIKTAEGQRVVVRPGDVEDRKTSDVSLMPEGLAQTMTDTELVDLLAFLTTLREPVSIAGQYHVIGPIDEPNGARTFDPTARIDLSASVRGSNGQNLSWRRLDANAEGLADLSAMAADGPGQVIYVYTPVTSPLEQKARLVVDTPASATVWLSGKSVIEPNPDQPSKLNQPREVDVSLPKGTSALLFRMTGTGRLAGQPTIVTTFVSPQPVSYSGGEASLSAR